MNHILLLSALVALLAHGAIVNTYDNNLVVKCMNEGEVLLTYDGGPSSNNTGRLLDILKKENVTAAFFLTASQTAQNEQLAKRILEEKHSVGYRLEYEWNVTKMTEEALYNSVEYKLDQMKRMLQKRPRVLRAAVEETGTKNNGLTFDMVQKLKYAGYTIVGEQIAGRDGNLTLIGKWPEPVQAVQQVLQSMSSKTGSPIIRLHDMNWLTVNQTKAIIDTVRQAGFKFVNVSACLGIDVVYQGDVEKIGKFYDPSNPIVKNNPQDDGKIFRGQGAQNHANGLKSGNLLMALVLGVLLL